MIFNMILLITINDLVNY